MRKRIARRGQTLVEFALIFPLMLMVTLAVVELGRFMFVYASVGAAAREASRYGAAVGTNADGVPYFQDCNGIEAAARRVATLISLSQIDIQYDKGDPSTAFSACPPPDTEIATGVRIHVTVTAEYHPFFFFQNTVTITADSAHTILRGVEVNE